MRADHTKPWTAEFSGAGVVIKSAKGYPIVFVYGIGPQAQKLADDILKIGEEDEEDQ